MDVEAACDDKRVLDKEFGELWSAQQQESTGASLMAGQEERLAEALVAAVILLPGRIADKINSHFPV